MIRLFEKPRRAVRLRNPRDKYSLRDQRLTIKSIMPGAEEGRRGVQLKKRGKFLGKVPISFAFNALHQLSWPH